MHTDPYAEWMHTDPYAEWILNVPQPLLKITNIKCFVLYCCKVCRTSGTYQNSGDHQISL